jgi:Xaa-Pro aminopeptidase
MNFTDNAYRFRQDSSFLYYFGLDVAGLAAMIDTESGEEIVFGTELTIDDIVWTGPLPTIKEMAHAVGVQVTKDFGDIDALLTKARSTGRTIHFLPPYRHDNLIRIATWMNIAIQEVKNHVSLPLIKSIVAQRSIKEPVEVQEMHKAALLTSDMHLTAMKYAKPGMKEYEIVSAVHQKAIAGGGELSFPIILTVNGETLHNHYHGNTIQEGQMILCDAGAETAMHYAGDMTCTFPVGKTFTSRQKDIYNIVLRTHEAAVDMLRPGILYRDIYLQAAENIFSGLKDLGITKGDPKEAVMAGAHAMFFQCGLGHMLGLDVHDMEDLGEIYVGYGDDMDKSTQFGMKSLRLGRALQAGFALTVEPGIYFIPTLIDKWKAEGKFEQYINYEVLAQYRDFSGIRIEEDFVITQEGSQLLGKSLPKSVAEIEDIRRIALT